MTLKLELASLDGLDATVAALYTEKDGKFRLDVDGVEDVSGLKAKIAELMGETKAERDKRKALEEAAEAAEAERAKQAGEFKTLYEKAQADLDKERAENRAFKQKIEEKDREGVAASIAGELTRDTSRAALLKKEALSFLKNSDDGVKFEIGGVGVDRAKVLEHLKAAYPFLVDGNQAGGGGAPGGGGGAAKTKLSEMTEAERVKLYRDNPTEFERLKAAG